MRLLSALLTAVALASAPVPVLSQTSPLTRVFDGNPATHRISVTVTAGIRSMTDLPDLYLRNARERLLRGERLPDAALRQLASLNEGLAAQRYARRLIARTGASASDIAYYSAIAIGTGRVSTLPDMVAAMGRLTPETEPGYRVRKYIQVLYAHAWAGNELALDAVIAFNGTGRLFGPLSDRTRQRILARAEAGEGRIALRMALRLMEDRPLADDQRIWALTYLDLAAASDHPGIASAAMALRRQLDKTVDPGG